MDLISKPRTFQVVALIFIGLLFFISFWLAWSKPLVMARYQVDKLIHFLAGSAVVAVVYFERPHFSRGALVGLVLAIGAGWEIFEYFGMMYLGWPTLGLSKRNYPLDTLADEIAVGLGAFLASLILQRPKLIQLPKENRK